jgi:hypothetical protein
MAKEVPLVAFATTLYFIPGPFRKFTVAHATWVLGSAFGGGGGGEEVFGVSTTGGDEGGDDSFPGSTDFWLRSFHRFFKLIIEIAEEFFS